MDYWLVDAYVEAVYTPVRRNDISRASCVTRRRTGRAQVYNSLIGENYVRASERLTNGSLEFCACLQAFGKIRFRL